MSASNIRYIPHQLDKEHEHLCLSRTEQTRTLSISQRKTTSVETSQRALSIQRLAYLNNREVKLGHVLISCNTYASAGGNYFLILTSQLNSRHLSLNYKKPEV